MHRFVQCFRRLCYSLGIKTSRRKCTGCRIDEHWVGQLIYCNTILDKREFVAAKGETYSTLSHSSLVLPRVCRSCDQKIAMLMVNLEHLQVWIVNSGEKISEVRVVRASDGAELIYLEKPHLCLVPPTKIGI